MESRNEEHEHSKERIDSNTVIINETTGVDKDSAKQEDQKQEETGNDDIENILDLIEFVRDDKEASDYMQKCADDKAKIKETLDQQIKQIHKENKKQEAENLVSKLETEKDEIAGLHVQADSRLISHEELKRKTRSYAFCSFKDIERVIINEKNNIEDTEKLSD